MIQYKLQTIVIYQIVGSGRMLRDLQCDPAIRSK